MRALRVVPMLPALLALGAAVAAAQAQPAARVLLAVRAGPGAAAVAPTAAAACRAGLERQGFAVLAAAEPAAAPAGLLAEAGRRGAAWVVEATVRGGEEIVIDAALTSVSDGARVAAVTLTGPEDLGVEHKSLRVAQELGARIRGRLATQPPPQAEPPPPHAPEPAALEPLPAPAAPGILPPPPVELLQERARMEQARASLRRDLEETQRLRRKARVRAALTWGLGTVALAGAAAAWYLADRSRAQYEDGEEGDNTSLRDDVTRYTWTAIGSAALGGLCAVGGAIFWLTRPDAAPIERALDRLDQGTGR